MPSRRSPGFGSCPTDSPPLKTVALARRLRPYRFPCAFPDDRVRLASQAHSLVRFSKRTTEHRLSAAPTAPSQAGRSPRSLSCPVAPSLSDFRPYCTSLCGVLYSVRSRYLSAIGLGECLVLAVNASRVHEGYPTLDTLELTHAVLVTRTGLSPCLALRSRRLRGDVPAMSVSPNTTLPEGFGLDCVAFTRGY